MAELSVTSLESAPSAPQDQASKRTHATPDAKPAKKAEPSVIPSAQIIPTQPLAKAEAVLQRLNTLA